MPEKLYSQGDEKQKVKGKSDAFGDVEKTKKDG